MVYNKTQVTGQYLLDLRKAHPFPDGKIDKEKVISWIEEYQENGDPEKLDLIVNSVGYLVISRAKYYARCCNLEEYTSDFIQEANLVVHKAVKTFKSSYNCSFATYIWRRVNSRIIYRMLALIKDRQRLVVPEVRFSEDPKANAIEQKFAGPDEALPLFERIHEDQVQNLTVQYLIENFPPEDVEIFLLKKGLSGGKPMFAREVAQLLGISTQVVTYRVQKITKDPEFKWYFRQLLYKDDSIPKPPERRIWNKSKKLREEKIQFRMRLEKRVELVYEVVSKEFGIGVDWVIDCFHSKKLNENWVAWSIAWLLFHNIGATSEQVSPIVEMSVHDLALRRARCKRRMKVDAKFETRILQLEEKFLDALE